MAKIEDRMCQAAARSLISSLDSLQSDHFENNHLPDELISVISKFNLTQQRSLIRNARKFLSVKLNTSALEHQIAELENSREERELEDTYLLQGAPLVLMRRLFGMHASEFSRRRHALKIQGAGSGRPPQCDESTEHKVWSLWTRFQDIEERERFMKIAEEIGLDLHLIWSALREHIGT